MIKQLTNFISPQDCDKLIQIHSDKDFYEIRTNLAVFDQDGESSKQDPDRFSEGKILRRDNPFVFNLLHKVSKILEVPYENLESPMICRYELNGEYGPHFDWVFRDEPLKEGNRIKTFMIYLNDDLGGGETFFPELKKKIIPERGKAIFWWNANPNKLDELNKKSLHCSLGASKKNKYIFIVWAREKAYVDYEWKRYMENGRLRLPLIYEQHENFLSKKLSQELIDWFTDETRASKGLMTLIPGQTINFKTKHGERRATDYRKAENLSFKKNGKIAKKFNKRLCKILEIEEPEYLEDWIFIKYKEGGEYKEHPDFVDEDLTYAEDDMKKNGGLRLKTVLIYLNDDFEGGETFFPFIDLKIKPKTGKLVIWENILGNLKKNIYSIHAGLPVSKGTKYLILTWVRQEKRP